eukprot:360936-Chlamydomonas_euryale.AAC.4
MSVKGAPRFVGLEQVDWLKERPLKCFMSHHQIPSTKSEEHARSGHKEAYSIAHRPTDWVDWKSHISTYFLQRIGVDPPGQQPVSAAILLERSALSESQPHPSRNLAQSV